MRLQPSVLKEYALERAILPMPVSASFTADDDSLVLEDEYGRVPLVAAPDCDLRVHQLVTGVVLALVGEEIDGGDLLVHSVIEPGCPPQLPLRDPTPLPRLVAFVSDLAIGTADGELALRHEMLSDFLLSSPLAPRIGRLIIAGNLVAAPAAAAAELPSGTKPLSARSLSQLAAPVNAADIFLARLCASLVVDVVPGAQDPASFALPQQPLNMCLFPVASHFPSLSATTNPYEATIDGVSIVGNGGQVAESMLRYVRDMTALDTMRKCLEWRHMAPTAPDALACYPFVQRDRFVLTRTPNVYFVGDQNEFESELAELAIGPIGAEGQDAAAVATAASSSAKARVRLLRVPKFSQTNTLVLLDLNTLDVETVKFDTLF
jgi:DNA polymerase delta subunit 2